MDFTQKKKLNINQEKYHIENLKIARQFSKEILLEMNELVRSIVIFGSNTTNKIKKDSDIDLMIVLDNISVFVSEELREAYRIITTKLISKISPKIHLTTINLSDLWDMSRKGDPILINILRQGYPLFDRDLVEPLQYLLEIGKIKPSRETVYNYIARSETLMNETKHHMTNATLDLYYAIIDIVHATLITKGIAPPSPNEMPKIFKKEFKDTSLEKYSKYIEEFYKLEKDIDYKKIGKISGSQFDKYEKKANKLILDLKKFIDKEISKKDMFDL